MLIKLSTNSYPAIIPLLLSVVQAFYVNIFPRSRYDVASEKIRVVEENTLNIETDPESTLSRSLSLGRLSKWT